MQKQVRRASSSQLCLFHYLPRYLPRISLASSVYSFCPRKLSGSVCVLFIAATASVDLVELVELVHLREGELFAAVFLLLLVKGML